MTFAELVPYVAAIPGIDRIRYTTSHPVEFTDALIETYRHVPELVSHLHLPVQAGSDRMRSLPACTGRCRWLTSSGTWR